MKTFEIAFVCGLLCAAAMMIGTFIKIGNNTKAIMAISKSQTGIEFAATKKVPLNAASTQATFSVLVPANWKPGSPPISVSIPGRGVFAINVPPSVVAGQTFLFQIADPSASADTSDQPSLRRAKAASLSSFRRQRSAATTEPGTQMHGLTSLDSMLTLERKIRQSMGRIRNTWKDTPKALKQARRWIAEAGTMLAAEAAGDPALASITRPDFIPLLNASKQPGWDPANPNGFPAGPPGPGDINGVPGYTFAENGEDLSVEDQGPGYYQPVDPEHWPEYLQMIQTDCYSAKGQPWLDHSNCAYLVHRSHTYPNDDPWRFSGAFGWNPPFPPGVNATNAPGAKAPDASEYWNYGDDAGFASAATWDGAKYAPPPPPPAASK